MSDSLKRHLFVKDVHVSQEYITALKVNIKTTLPQRNRKEHGEELISALSYIWNEFTAEKEFREDLSMPVRNGEYLTFTSAKNDTLKVESLDTSGAVLLKVNTNSETKQQKATVFIPENQKDNLVRKVQDYLWRDNNGKPVNQPLVDKIDLISTTSLRQLWSSPIDTLPSSAFVWCELWMATEGLDIEKVQADLKNVCAYFDIEIREDFVQFPQRTIFIVKVDYESLVELISSIGLIAEIRKTEELNSFWRTTNGPIVNNAWIDEALRLVDFTKTNNFISILDTGVNNGHSLLKPALDDENKLVENSNWGVHDKDGHGTKMAGVALYGNLNAMLENNQNISIHHQIESLKILDFEFPNNRNDYPTVTKNAVNRAIIDNPGNKRIFCMAITTDFQVEFGKPSTYSSVLDNIIFGEDDKDKKIFLVSAGNVQQKDCVNYPQVNLDSSIESPAQAWNAISIGAYTEKIMPDFNMLAQKYELSPFSTTSASWESNWPIKPEVVFEGGNLIHHGGDQLESHDDLEVLTVSRNPLTHSFSTINATSSATAFAAFFIAKVRDVYPDAWEETLRALMIHSASWTAEMIAQFSIDTSKVGDVLRLMRIVGYGIPNLQKAIACKSNYLTFISEQLIKPYKLVGSEVKTNEIHYYEFPWPKEILENLGSADVTLRVTLSYFIEPNPGDRGYTTKYAYQSTALRFSLIRADEDFDNFKIRTNKISQNTLKETLGVEKLEKGAFDSKTGTDRWALGADTVFKGSVHSNYWKGSAADIASCNKLAIFPLASGWWKELKKQRKYDSELRYSLIVSIETPKNSTDIYTPIATQIANQVAVENIVVN